jgi:hypothetical protein
MGCSNQEEIHSLKKGKYATQKQNELKSAYYDFVHNTIFIIGDTLTIYDRVNFAYTSCGEYGFGKYEIVGDSLSLNFDSSATHRDSIMLYNKYTETYYIEDNNTLTSEFGLSLTRKGEVKYNGISELHYVIDAHKN